MKFIVDINPTKYEGRSVAWIAKELFVVLVSECVDVQDVKHISEVKPKVVSIREEHGKPIISVEI